MAAKQPLRRIPPQSGNPKSSPCDDQDLFELGVYLVWAPHKLNLGSLRRQTGKQTIGILESHRGLGRDVPAQLVLVALLEAGQDLAAKNKLHGLRLDLRMDGIV